MSRRESSIARNSEVPEIPRRPDVEPPKPKRFTRQKKAPLYNVPALPTGPLPPPLPETRMREQELVRRYARALRHTEIYQPSDEDVELVDDGSTPDGVANPATTLETVDRTTETHPVVEDHEITPDDTELIDQPAADRATPAPASSERKRKTGPRSRGAETKTIDTGWDDLMQRDIAAEQAEKTREHMLEMASLDIERHRSVAAETGYHVMLVQEMVSKNQITYDVAERYLTRLRNDEVECREALQQNIGRPNEIQQTPEVRDEREFLEGALRSIDRACRDIQRSLDEISQAPTEVAAYEAARQSSANAYRSVVEQAVQLREQALNGDISTEEREHAVELLHLQATRIEHVLAQAVDAGWGDDAQTTSEYEAAASALAEIHRSIYEFQRATHEEIESQRATHPVKESVYDLPNAPTPEEVTVPSQPRSHEPAMADALEEADFMIRNTELFLDQNEIQSEDVRFKLLLDLSHRYADLSDRQGLLRLRPYHEDANNRKEIERIAEALHAIEDLRHRLHELNGNTQAVKDRVSLRKTEKQDERVTKLASQQQSLAREVKKSYGQSPEELEKNGIPLGLRLKHSLGRLMNQADPLATWREAKQARTQADLERAPEPVAPSSLEETMTDDQAELPDTKTLREAITFAESHGVQKAEALYYALADQPTRSLWGFSPEEYLIQLGELNQARKGQRQRVRWPRFLSKRDVSASKEVLLEMQKELKGYGVNPKNGMALTEDR